MNDLTIKDALPVLFVLVILMWVMWIAQRRRARQASSRSDRISPAALDRRHSLQRAMEELEVNLMEFGRDVEARIDTKLVTLQQLIHDADERIERLQALAGTPPAQSGTSPLALKVYELADQGLDKIEIARRADVTPGEVELILGLRRSRGV